MISRVLSKNSFVSLHWQTVRWKGHSKWQNIQSQKNQSDLERARVVHKYSMWISIAIREHKGSGGTDPNVNKTLAR